MKTRKTAFTQLDKALEACYAVLEWARTPHEHGGNPYALLMVKKAEIAIAKHEAREPEDWAIPRSK